MSTRNYLLIAGSLLILVAILATGCMSTPVTTPLGSSDLKKFNSTAEIDQYVRASMATEQYDGYYRTMVPTAGQALA